MGLWEAKNIRAAVQLLKETRHLDLTSSCGLIVLKALGAKVDLDTSLAIEGFGINTNNWAERSGLRLIWESAIKINPSLPHQPELLNQFLLFPKSEGTPGKILGTIVELIDKDQEDGNNHVFLIVPRGDLPRDWRRQLKQKNQWLIVDARLENGYGIIDLKDLTDYLYFSAENGFNVYLIPVSSR